MAKYTVSIEFAGNNLTLTGVRKEVVLAIKTSDFSKPHMLVNSDDKQHVIINMPNVNYISIKEEEDEV